MISDAHSAAALRTAQTLLRTRSVLVRPEAPFTLTSGRKSPVYVDCRRLLSFPQERDQLVADAIDVIVALEAKRGRPFTTIAGGETAGIAFAALIAHMLGRKMIYVRKQAKGFGRLSRIEGVLSPQDDVLLVEDMATDGASKLSFVRALTDAGATCTDAFVWFYYDLHGSRAFLSQNQITLSYLATWETVFAAAQTESPPWPQATCDIVRTFLHGAPHHAERDSGRSP